MKKILILGATGRTGSLVIKELSKYESVQIIAALRKQEDRERLSVLKQPVETALIDINDVKNMQKSLIDCDVIVQAIRLREDISEEALIQLDKNIRQAINPSKKVQIVTVGGAGSLRLSKGQRFWEDRHFPKQTLPRGIAHAKLRDYLEKSPFKDPWAYLIPPPAYIVDGKKRGYQKYRSAQEEDFFINQTVSYSDFALAVADAVMEKWQGVYLIAGQE